MKTATVADNPTIDSMSVYPNNNNGDQIVSAREHKFNISSNDDIILPMSKTYWQEFYSPDEYTSFESCFLITMNSTTRYRSSTTTSTPISATAAGGTTATTAAATLPTTTESAEPEITNPFADRGGCGDEEPTIFSTKSQTRPQSKTGAQMVKTPASIDGQIPPARPKQQGFTGNGTSMKQRIYEKLQDQLRIDEVEQPLTSYIVGGWYTDGVTKELQEPKLTEDEYRQYEKYVHQFDDLTNWIIEPPSNRIDGSRNSRSWILWISAAAATATVTWFERAEIRSDLYL